MKVLMLNGSRREHGCTDTALRLVAEELGAQGIDSEIVFVGADATNGNINALIQTLKVKCAEADGFVFGAPVYYASPSGESQIVLDRLFGAAGADMRHKPAAIVTSARRAGTTASLDVLAKYPSINEMPIVTSCYWTMVHGNTPEEVMQDAEGVYVMQQLARNMAWILQSIAAGKAAGVAQPAAGDKPRMNFIR